MKSVSKYFQQASVSSKAYEKGQVHLFSNVRNPFSDKTQGVGRDARCHAKAVSEVSKDGHQPNNSVLSVPSIRVVLHATTIICNNSVILLWESSASPDLPMSWSPASLTCTDALPSCQQRGNGSSDLSCCCQHHNISVDLLSCYQQYFKRFMLSEAGCLLLGGQGTHGQKKTFKTI